MKLTYSNFNRIDSSCKSAIKSSIVLFIPLIIETAFIIIRTPQ